MQVRNWTWPGVRRSKVLSLTGAGIALVLHSPLTSGQQGDSCDNKVLKIPDQAYILYRVWQYGHCFYVRRTGHGAGINISTVLIQCFIMAKFSVSFYQSFFIIIYEGCSEIIEKVGIDYLAFLYLPLKVSFVVFLLICWHNINKLRKCH